MFRPRLRDGVVGALAFLLGSAVAFFGLGPALFSDGGGGERIIVLGVSIATFFVLGVAVGFASPGWWKVSAGCLIVPSFPVAAIFADDAATQVALAVLLGLFLLGDAAAAFAGALLGARLRSGRG